MKRACYVLIISLVCVLLGGCAGGFMITDDDQLTSINGTEYNYFASEGALCYIGELEYVGPVSNDQNFKNLLIKLFYGWDWEPGVYAIKGDTTQDVLIRYEALNEWASIYRDASLEPFDYSLDNCNRLEFVSEKGSYFIDRSHADCGEGISDRAVIQEFLREIRLQENPRDAGLYDLVDPKTGSDCYLYGYLCGYVEEESNLIRRLEVYSFDDQAYSIHIDAFEYVLPDEWLQRFMHPEQ